jgi:hypothetical protein
MSLDNAESVPKPIEVGQEMAALRRFYRDSRWAGWIHEGGMGPGTPKMKGIGRATFRPIQGGRWWVGDFEQDQFLLDGTFVLRVEASVTRTAWWPSRPACHNPSP